MNVVLQITGVKFMEEKYVPSDYIIYTTYFKETNLTSKVNSELAGRPGRACLP